MTDDATTGRRAPSCEQRGPREPSREQSGSWVYAVLATPRPAVPATLRGVAGECVYTVPVPGDDAGSAGMSAVVGAVPLAAFEAAGTAQDRDRVAEIAGAHHRVLAELASTAPLVPFRLGTVYGDDARVARSLAAQRAQLEAALRLVTDHTEWGVKAYLHPHVPTAESTRPNGSARANGSARPDESARPVGSGRPDESGGPDGSGRSDGATRSSGRLGLRGTASAEAEAVSAGAGTAYLLRRQAERRAGEELRRTAGEFADDLDEALSGYADATSRFACHDSWTAQGRPWTILSASYLVAHPRTDQFIALVRALAERDPRLTLELTGPWPAYSVAAGDPRSGSETDLAKER